MIYNILINTQFRTVFSLSNDVIKRIEILITLKKCPVWPTRLCGRLLLFWNDELVSGWLFAHSSFLSPLEVSKPAKSRYSAFLSIGKFIWSLRVEPCLVHGKLWARKTKRFSQKLLWLSSISEPGRRKRFCKNHRGGERISLHTHGIVFVCRENNLFSRPLFF